MKSRSTKIRFPLRFGLFQQEQFCQFFGGQHPDVHVEEKNISIFVDKRTAMFVLSVFQIRPHQFLALEISPRVMLPVFRFQVLKMKLLISATPNTTQNGLLSHLLNPI